MRGGPPSNPALAARQGRQHPPGFEVAKDSDSASDYGRSFRQTLLAKSNGADQQIYST